MSPPASRSGAPGSRLRYAADEPPPHPACVVLGLQTAILVCTPLVVVTTIAVRAANLGEAYLAWAIFASLVIGGLTTVLQARRVAGIGAGNLLVMGASGASMGVAVLALVVGGPPLLGALVVATALCQFGLAAKLALLRRVVTPMVSGTLLALVAVTVMPMGFALLTEVPASASPLAAPAITLTTLVAVLGLMLRAPRMLRAWTPVIGIGTGCATAAFFGVFDFGRMEAASWFGIPTPVSPGLAFSFDSGFWLLLPAFLFITLVITVRQVGDGIVIQRLSRREPKAIDFRRVQGGVAACGVGTLLSGFAGTLPIRSYPAGIALAEGIGVAARRVGVYIGALLVVLAFVPKLAALVISIPGPVLGAYIVALMGIVFMRGMRVIVRSDTGRRGYMVAGFSFWIGVGVEFEAIFPGYLATPVGQSLASGLTAGGVSLLLLQLFLRVTGSRRRRIEVALSADSLPELDRFLVSFAGRHDWGETAVDRLRAASEEAVLSLARQEEDDGADADRRLSVVARSERGGARLEFIAGTHAANLENEIVQLSDLPDLESTRDLSLRLLRHHASSVKHQQYHNVDILTIRVDK